MTHEQTSPPQDALVMIFLRQAFYLRQLRLMAVVVLLNVLLILVLMGMLFYFIRHPTHPLYFPTDKLGRLRVEPSLRQPNMPLDEVQTWVIRAVQAAYSYDFINYRKQFQNAQKYFTDYGWRQYMKGLQASNNLLALTERKMVVIAQVVERPKLVVQGILAGRYAWKFEMPVLVQYLEPPYDDKSRFSNALRMKVIVQRQDTNESDRGLGIVQMVANLAISAPQQNEMSMGEDHAGHA